MKRRIGNFAIALASFVMAIALTASTYALTYNQIENQIDTILNRSAVANNTWTILIQNRDGSITYYDRNADTPRIHATKIFKSAAAYEELGYNHY